MDPLLDYTDKVVLITGAASGFGELLAHEFSARGARLVLGDINEPGLEAVAARLPGPAAAMVCDVSQQDNCQALVEAAIELYGQLDIAINNAGIVQGFTPFEDIDDDLIERQMAVNFNGVLYGMKHQIVAMKEQGNGVILNVSSLAGIGAAPKMAVYSASKHAVVGITKSAAIEYASCGIRINAVCPFFSLTPMVTDSELSSGKTAAELESRLGKNTPMRRLAQAQEIVNTMVLLCSPGNTFMTGQTIAIDGGITAA